MTINIQKARKSLPEKYQKCSDQEIQKILDFLYAVARTFIESFEKDSAN